jgi:hypothetical protein
MSITRVVTDSLATVTFDRKVSSEAGWDYLMFYVDDNYISAWSGEQDWSKVGCFVSAGTHTFKWVYSKDSSVSSGDDTVWVDNVKIQKYPTYFNGFESGVLAPFVTSGDANWLVTSTDPFSGTYSAKAGTITDSQHTDLELTRGITVGGEAIGFIFKVSSEYYWDYLRFYIDGVEQSAWSGETDWCWAGFPVDEGNNTFKWSYTKDGSVSSGYDTAWLDEVIIGDFLFTDPTFILSDRKDREALKCFLNQSK